MEPELLGIFILYHEKALQGRWKDRVSKPHNPIETEQLGDKSFGVCTLGGPGVLTLRETLFWEPSWFGYDAK